MILHVDMDAFYASVELRDNPALVGQPVVVGGSPKGRGVVAAASYEARKFGVFSAMPAAHVLRLCPSAVFIKPRMEHYAAISKQIREIFFQFTSLVEPLSLDEAFLDVTKNKKEMGSATAIAEEIRKQIFEETKLTASAGVSFNKFLAKVASDINKPNGITIIRPKESLEFVAKLPIEKFFGIGKVTAKRMHGMGIHTGHDLKQISEIELVQRFGKVGRHYYKIVRAKDDRPVNPNRKRKSISAERTFSEDITSTVEMQEQLRGIAERVFLYMKKTENYGRTVNIKMKTPDFQVFTRSKTFSGELKKQNQFFEIVDELIKLHGDEVGAVRLLGVGVSNLSKEYMEDGIQLEFDFED